VALSKKGDYSMPKGPRILVPTEDAPVLGPIAPTGLCRAPNGGWLVVNRGSVTATLRGPGSKRRAIQASGTNRVIA
jgi:hypothetical protein